MANKCSQNLEINRKCKSYTEERSTEAIYLEFLNLSELSEAEHLLYAVRRQSSDRRAIPPVHEADCIKESEPTAQQKFLFFSNDIPPVFTMTVSNAGM